MPLGTDRARQVISTWRVKLPKPRKPRLPKLPRPDLYVAARAVTGWEEIKKFVRDLRTLPPVEFYRLWRNEARKKCIEIDATRAREVLLRADLDFSLGKGYEDLKDKYVEINEILANKRGETDFYMLEFLGLGLW